MKAISVVFYINVFFTLINLQKAYSQDKLNVMFFGDYYYNAQRDTLSTTLNNAVLNDANNLNGFKYRRVYLTYNHKFDSRFSAKIGFDSDQESNTTNGKFGFFVKDAYLNWDSIFKNASLSFGLLCIPTISTSEKWWGHRFLEKTITDLRKFESTRDMGISLKGSFAKNQFFYTIMLGNNSGSKVEIDRFKSLYGVIGYNPSKSFIFSLSYTYHFMKKSLDLYDTLPPMNWLNKDKSLITFFIGYQKENKFSTGLELFYATQKHDLNTGFGFDDYSSYGATFFVNYAFNEKLSFTGRVDYFEPNNHRLSTHDCRIYALWACNIHVQKSIIISPNLLSEFYEKMSNGTKIKPAITPRITFYWKY